MIKKLDRSCRLLNGQSRQPFDWNYFPILIIWKKKFLWWRTELTIFFRYLFISFLFERIMNWLSFFKFSYSKLDVLSISHNYFFGIHTNYILRTFVVFNNWENIPDGRDEWIFHLTQVHECKPSQNPWNAKNWTSCKLSNTFFCTALRIHIQSDRTHWKAPFEEQRDTVYRCWIRKTAVRFDLTAPLY